MNTVRLGIIGMGNIGRFHAGYLAEGKVDRCQLTAVCARHSEGLDAFSPARDFTDGEELIRSGEVDAVVIATPHPHHAAAGIAALQAGIHVIVEKPIAAHKSDGERLIAVHEQHPDVVFAAMYQFRSQPRYQKLRQMIREGQLGRIVRVSWINTDWFRTEAYYASADWRATWKADGGGVLLNQCLHNLDTLQWMLGMPSRVRGLCQFGRYHQIEVEDDVTAWLEWADGANGVFISSTGEAPGTNRLEIAGSLGRCMLEHGKLTFDRNATDMLEYNQNSEDGFGMPESAQEGIPVEEAVAPHATLMQNFVNAILDGEPLIAPGAEGIHSLELANAIVFSSLTDQTLDLPMDGAAWEAKLRELIAGSTVQKRATKGAAGDVASSFR